MGLSITESYGSFNYGIQGKGRASKDKDDSFETMGSATSVTTSSDKGKNIGVTTVGNRGYIAKYADTSTEADPVVKVGDYEIHVNDVDPRQATGMEMFALMSYMDDKGLTDNSEMKSYNKMTAYSNRPEYNENDTWSLDKDWVNLLNNAKESFFSIPDTYQQGLNCQSILESLGRWSNTRSGYDYEEVGISDYSDEEWDNLIKEIDRKISELMGSSSERIEVYDDDDHIHGNADLLTARYTVYKKSMSYVDPDSSTNEVVNNGYVGRTFFTQNGIVYQQAGYSTKEGGVTNLRGWHIDFDNEGDYERAMSFLDRLPEGDNTIFSTRKAFWEDFISGEIDEDEFMEYYNTLDHGVANWVKSDENGKSYLDREMMDSKFFKYFGIQQVGMIANETIDSEFSTRIRIQNGQKNRGNIDTADLIRKTVSSKPDYMPYAGNHVIKNKNEYLAMAKDDMIFYQGVVFMCDRLTDTLTLGDVSDPNNCIRVGLSKGGSLLFNRNDAGSLMNAITMFSPEDQERIVKAIQIDNMAQKARKDVEDAKSGESVRSSDEAETDTDRNEESYEHI